MTTQTLSCGCIIGDVGAGIKHQHCPEGQRLKDIASQIADRIDFAKGVRREVLCYKYSEAKRRHLQHFANVGDQS